MCSWSGVEILFRCRNRLFDILIIMVEFLQCYFDAANFLQDLLVFTPLIQCCMTLFAIWLFSIKFITFCNNRIKMHYRNDFWECIKPALVKLNQQVLHCFKDQRCDNYRDHVFSARPFRRHLFRCCTFFAQIISAPIRCSLTVHLFRVRALG